MEISTRHIRTLPFFALIVAGGSGTRLGGDIPKQYQLVNGYSLLRHSLDSFLNCPGLRGVQVVIGTRDEPLYRDSLSGLSSAAMDLILQPVHGGHERKDSVSNGLRALCSHMKDTDIVLIHDAARPFVAVSEIMATVNATAETGAASLGVPVTGTLRHQDGHYVAREKLWEMQTPQGFHFKLILDAHDHAKDNSVTYTDDTSMIASTGHEVTVVPGSRSNFKITTEDDMQMAQTMMRGLETPETRTATGFDVHAFAADKSARTIKLCGVDVPSERALIGHSDADVGLHALTDALLGTIAAGDIGTHFPPSDPQWKGMDSAHFLKTAIDLVRAAGGRIVTLDLTLICERPKVGPHRNAMQARIADICAIDPSRVSIKATTTEGLGFTGRGEGIAAQAAASVEFPRHATAMKAAA